MSATFINLEDITLNIFMTPLFWKFKKGQIETDGAMQQTMLIIGILSNQRA